MRRPREPASRGEDVEPAGHAQLLDEGRKKGLLFVCTANVCRSPMAEAIFNALAEDAALPYEATSAGVAALVNEPVAPRAKTVLAEMGLHAAGHHARQVDKEMLEGADLVLAMTPNHAFELRHLSADSAPKVSTLLGFAEDRPEEGVPDPYGYSLTTYRASARQLFHCARLVVDRLGREQGGRIPTP